MSIVLAILEYGEVEHAKTIAGCSSLCITKVLTDNPLNLTAFGDVVEFALTLNLKIDNTIGNALVGTLHGNLVADRSTFLKYHVLFVGGELGHNVAPSILLSIDLDHSTAYRSEQRQSGVATVSILRVVVTLNAVLCQSLVAVESHDVEVVVLAVHDLVRCSKCIANFDGTVDAAPLITSCYV